MKYTNFKKELILLIPILAPCIYLAWGWNALPKQVPMHFDANGNINGWGGKVSELGPPAIALVVYLVTLFIPLIDPKKMNYEFFQGIYFKIRLVLFLFAGITNLLLINAGLTGHMPGSPRLLSGSAFLLLAVIGNFLINVKPTWFVGIRTPWTLNSDTVWKKTHMVGGRLFFYGGLICFILSFLLGADMFEYLLLAFVIGVTGFLFGYSFWLYQKEQKMKGENTGT